MKLLWTFIAVSEALAQAAVSSYVESRPPVYIANPPPAPSLPAPSLPAPSIPAPATPAPDSQYTLSIDFVLPTPTEPAPNTGVSTGVAAESSSCSEAAAPSMPAPVNPGPDVVQTLESTPCLETFTPVITIAIDPVPIVPPPVAPEPAPMTPEPVPMSPEPAPVQPVYTAPVAPALPPADSSVEADRTSEAIPASGATPCPEEGASLPPAPAVPEPAPMTPAPMTPAMPVYTAPPPPVVPALPLPSSSVEADRTYEVPEATPCAEGGASVPPAPVVPEPEVPIAPAPEPLPTTNEPAPPVAPEPSSVEAASTALFTATPPPGGFPAPSAPQPAPPAPTEAETSCTEAEATAETASPAATVTVTEYVDAPCMPVTVTETSYVIPFYSLLPLGPGPVIWTSMPNGVPAVPMPTDAAPAPPVSTAPCASSWPQM